MTKDVAHHFGRRAPFDLSTRVRVAKHVTAKEAWRQPGRGSVLGETMPDHARRRQTKMRQVVRHEDLTSRHVRGPSVPEVVGKGLSDGVEKRQNDRCAGLRATHAKRPALPVDVVDPQAKHLACAHAVGRHRLQQREVATTERIAKINRLQQSSDILPGHRPRGVIAGADPGSYHAGCDVMTKSTVRDAEAKKGAH